MQILHLYVVQPHMTEDMQILHLYVVQPVQLDVPSLEVNIDNPWLCLVEVQGLHHREWILDEKLVREDVEGARQLSEATRGDPHIQHSSYCLLSNNVPEGNFVLLRCEQTRLSLRCPNNRLHIPFHGGVAVGDISKKKWR